MDNNISTLFKLCNYGMNCWRDLILYDTEVENKLYVALLATEPVQLISCFPYLMQEYVM